jgi:hypothetical protein
VWSRWGLREGERCKQRNVGGVPLPWEMAYTPAPSFKLTKQRFFRLPSSRIGIAC